MQKPKNSYTTWIRKANNDLRAAKKLAANPDPIFDMAIFHTQQCAEKALKSFLASHEVLPPKTHDLDYLIHQCCTFNTLFKNLFDCTELLQPYCFKFRYPDDIFSPDELETHDAIICAEKILIFVKKVINELNDPTLKLF